MTIQYQQKATKSTCFAVRCPKNKRFQQYLPPYFGGRKMKTNIQILLNTIGIFICTALICKADIGAWTLAITNYLIFFLIFVRLKNGKEKKLD